MAQKLTLFFVVFLLLLSGCGRNNASDQVPIQDLDAGTVDDFAPVISAADVVCPTCPTCNCHCEASVSCPPCNNQSDVQPCECGHCDDNQMDGSTIILVMDVADILSTFDVVEIAELHDSSLVIVADQREECKQLRLNQGWLIPDAGTPHVGEPEQNQCGCNISSDRAFANYALINRCHPNLARSMLHVREFCIAYGGIFTSCPVEQSDAGMNRPNRPVRPGLGRRPRAQNNSDGGRAMTPEEEDENFSPTTIGRGTNISQIEESEEAQ